MLIDETKGTKLKEKLLLAFSFFGPLGNLIPILPMIAGFRFFYVLVIIGGICFLVHQKSKMEKYILLAFSPVLIYSFFSSLIYISYSKIEGINSDNPLIRFFLVISLFLFAIYVGSLQGDINRIQRVIKCYLNGYLLSLVAGYVILIGFSLGWISIPELRYVEVLPQMGYGYLRFSPGSYPNEYGNVSSFVLSIITFYFIFNINVFKKKYLLLLYIFIFAALIMTSTRAAYISYFICLLFLLVKRAVGGHFLYAGKVVLLVFAGISVFYYIVQTYFLDIKSLFLLGYESFINNEGSSAERFSAWEDAVEMFMDDNFILGCGFGIFGELHNLFLQLLFELGFLGILIALLCIIIVKVILVKTTNDFSSWTIVELGWVHIILFGFSNHNLNHHLTWFIIILTLLHYKTKTIRYIKHTN